MGAGREYGAGQKEDEPGIARLLRASRALLLGIFFLGSVQIFVIGLLGEYVGAVLTQVRQRPLVVERERIGTASRD